ncbi:MAG: HAD-IC family P-type ATPase [Methanosarcinaceae archaeon]|nr:HAD-IC family P-type ATPase [Methanosarcinaceae archaeon]
MKDIVPESDFAVVFDCAGTLVEMFRATRNVKNKEFISVSDNFELSKGLKHGGIVIFDVERKIIKEQDPKNCAYNFIKSGKSNLYVPYSNKPMNENDALELLKRTEIKMEEFHEVIKNVEKKYPSSIYEVTGFLADIENSDIPFIMSSGGELFESTEETVKYIQNLGCDTFISSGDDYFNLYRVADKISIEKTNVFGHMNPKDKKKLIRFLQKKYECVFMIGDGLNDLQALKKSDVGILVSKKDYYTPKKLKKNADFIVEDIAETGSLIKEIIENI